ncbi:MAG: adenine phosphoribosyltransferase [Elusimicrobiaceae bacterium]|jgi:adenine phosphoribosyltransferase|nr:adenine phosphoribosyltransferase [Elusimicrobiaceae bacterium]MBT3955290.1 adenine phosphoribosyltransferase [Elusimicrobiaceae bacterium]MBT4008426.1 adenine phosphoribosyltransferase [Elusimicrobiaceae bacterium]MBT4403235.1 adenine phosphoribosyltransferase [Elusimicrobiaceae bacterium]MBT4439315.1 adenine phosphoribosyltransferase [Elusimicrobiaceae bacterium]
MNTEELKKSIRDIPDFPKKGILFRDITTLLKDAKVLKETIELMAKDFRNKGITKVIGIESRGFIFGIPLALELNAGFVPVRKKGKLPAEVLSYEYELEYGTDTLEIHKDALNENDKVIIADDLLATGGTAKAALKLATDLGAKVESCVFLIELMDLKGRDKIVGTNIKTLIKY